MIFIVLNRPTSIYRRNSLSNIGNRRYKWKDYLFFRQPTKSVYTESKVGDEDDLGLNVYTGCRGRGLVCQSTHTAFRYMGSILSP